MGWHDSPKPETGYVHGAKKPKYDPKSSGDITISFANGQKWHFPDALTYYIYDCGYKPPEEFIHDIINEEVTEYHRHQTRSMGGNTCMSDKYNEAAGGSIGYLSPEEVNLSASKPWTPPDRFTENYRKKTLERSRNFSAQDHKNIQKLQQLLLEIKR